MFKNVSKSILLLSGFAFFLGSCGALRKAEDPYRHPSSTVKKSPSKSETAQLSSIRKEVTQQAKRCKGSRYKYGGKNKKGFDCSGFTSYVMNKVDININGSSRSQAKMGQKVSIRKAKAGDLVFFGKKGKVTHVALVINNGKSGLEVIHSTSSKGVIIQNVSQSTYWKPKMLFVRDVIGD